MVEFKEGLTVEAQKTQEIILPVSKAGTYKLAVVYSSSEYNLFDNPVDITVGSQTLISELPFLWADDISDIRTDRYGNEILPEQYPLPYAVSWIEDYESFSRLPLEFDLQSGEVNITFTPQNQSMILYGIYAVRVSEDLTYEQYMSQYAGVTEYRGGVITIQGEDFRAKSDSSIRGTYVANTSLEPFSPYVKLINATANESNKTIGQTTEYIHSLDNFRTTETVLPPKKFLKKFQKNRENYL